MKNIISILFLVTIVLAVSGCGAGAGLTADEKRLMIADMEKRTLQQLYSQEYSAKDKVNSAAGYGVFSNANVNLILVGAGGGYGVVVDNTTGKKTYMRMAMGGVGPGLGVKDYRLILIFKEKYVLDDFIENGWDFNAHADATATTTDKGSEVSGVENLNIDIEAYSITQTGLSAQASLTGTKYWKDSELNKD